MSEGEIPGSSFFAHLAAEHEVQKQQSQLEAEEFKAGFRSLVSELDDFQLKIMLMAIMGAGADRDTARHMGGQIVGHFEFVRGIDPQTLEAL